MTATNPGNARPAAVDRVERQELLARTSVEALAALLDIEPPVDDVVPPLWHVVLLLERPAQRDLGPDGHPTTGIPTPPAEGTRRMFAGGRVTTYVPLVVGERAERTTWISSSRETIGRTGPLTFVTVRHELTQSGRLAVAEEHDIVYRAPGPALSPTVGPTPPPESSQPALRLDVDETLLFRFSALTYNAHRIHYDLTWAQHEGYADLVVHGPLQALLMAELLRRQGVSLVGRQFAYRLVAPVIGPQQITASGVGSSPLAAAEVRGADGTRTATGEVLTPAEV